VLSIGSARVVWRADAWPNPAWRL